MLFLLNQDTKLMNTSENYTSFWSRIDIAWLCRRSYLKNACFWFISINKTFICSNKTTMSTKNTDAKGTRKQTQKI